MLPGGARFVSVSDDGTAKLWTLNGALERTFEVGSEVLCVAALPDGVHFVVGLGINEDGTRSRTSSGCTTSTGRASTPSPGTPATVNAVAVTPDGQHIISGSHDNLVKVWSVATKSLVSTCAAHQLAVAAMPDGQRFLSGSSDATVRGVAPRRHPQELFQAARPR